MSCSFTGYGLISSMNSHRGRPPLLDPDIMFSVISRHKKEVCLPNRKICSQLHDIWTTIKVEVEAQCPALRGKIKQKSLYTYVSDDRNGIRTKLQGRTAENLDSSVANSTILNSTSEDRVEDPNCNMASSDGRKLNVFKTTFTIKKKRFMKYVEEVEVVRTSNKSGKSLRQKKRLKPGKWQ